MKLNKQVVFTLVIGFMMITWIVGIALGSNLQINQQQGVKIESVYERLLQPEEKIGLLRSGRVVIEYIHSGGPESTEKRAVYENFVARFKDFAVLEVVEIDQQNQTMDQMIIPNGDIIPLENVTSGELTDVFCKNTFVQPKECLLRDI